MVEFLIHEEWFQRARTRSKFKWIVQWLSSSFVQFLAAFHLSISNLWFDETEKSKNPSLRRAISKMWQGFQRAHPKLERCRINDNDKLIFFCHQILEPKTPVDGLPYRFLVGNIFQKYASIQPGILSYLTDIALPSASPRARSYRAFNWIKFISAAAGFHVSLPSKFEEVHFSSTCSSVSLSATIIYWKGRLKFWRIIPICSFILSFCLFLPK